MKYSISLLIALLAYFSVSAQNLAVKTNILYDATATINLGVEVGLGQHTSVDLSGNYNAWTMDESINKKMRHILVQPEFRYYFCEKFNGHFLGAHALYTEYNVCGSNWLLNGVRDLSSLRNSYVPDSRCQGFGYGAGLSYGYDIMLSNRFNLELTLGAGFMHFDYDRYGAPECAPLLDSRKVNYLGITKLGVTLVYILK